MVLLPEKFQGRMIEAEREEGKSKEEIKRKLQRIFGMGECEAEEKVNLYCKE